MFAIGNLLDKQNCTLRMRRECRERFPRHRLQSKPLVSDPDMHHGTCATHVPWCMAESLTHGGGENVPGIPGACATRNFTYLARGPCTVIKGIWSSYDQYTCTEYMYVYSVRYPHESSWYFIYCGWNNNHPPVVYCNDNKIKHSKH